MSNERVTELWAVLNDDGSVKWSRGGSSTRPHLMVYPSEKAARRALDNQWTKQVRDGWNDSRILRLYDAMRSG